MLYLIDHASHQGIIDMQRLKDLGHSAEIGKATGEGNYVNPNYAQNHAAAIAAGLITGSYDWVEPQDARDPEFLAEDYLRVVDTLGGRPKGHLLGVDFETPEWFTGPRGREVEDFMRRYVMRLLEISGQGIEFYTGPYFMQETGGVNWGWLNHPKIRLWLAAPGEGMMADDSYWPNVDIRPFTEASIHQHQWHAMDRAIGSGAEFDRNRFRGTIIDLAANGAQGAATVARKEAIAVVDERHFIAVPPRGKWSGEVINGVGVLVLAFDGETTPDGIVGIDIVDVGITVKSATEEGVTISMSFKDEQFTGFQENRDGTRLDIAQQISEGLSDPKS